MEMSYFYDRLADGVASGEFKDGTTINVAVVFSHLSRSQMDHAIYQADGYTGSKESRPGLLSNYSYQWIEGTSLLVVWYPARRTPRRAVEDALAEWKATSQKS